MSAEPPRRPDGAPWRNVYVRRRGKGLRKGRRGLLETRLADYVPKGVSWAENPERRPIDPWALFPDVREVWLEVGFGGGEHVLALAEAHPEVGIIGSEVFLDGVAKLLAGVGENGLDNVLIYPGDARDLLDVLPEASIARVYVLYPDPWPKKRHWKRRFISPENLGQLARVMAPGAQLYLATDIPDYVRHTLELVVRDPRFEWLAASPRDWRQPWPEWPGTRYESKALAEGRRPHYLIFRRR